MLDTTKYPIDFDALQKGDVISNDNLEKITGHKFGTDRFSFAVISLREQIYKHRRFTSTHNKELGLRILVDSEASIYNNKDFHNKRRGMVRANHKMASVDVAQLSPVAKELHERSLLNQSRIISGMRSPKKITVKVEEPKKLTE